MMTKEFTETRTGLANNFAAAGADLLAYMGSAAALAAIPDTDPPRYVVAGTLADIVKLLPAADVIRPSVATTAGEQAEPVIHWASEKFVHERIATLMAQAGVPESTPLWNAFCQFEADLRSRVSAAPASPEQVQAGLSDEKIADLFEQAISYPMADEDYAGVRQLVRLIEKELAAAPSAAAPAAEEVQWISAKDRMPDDGQVVLILCTDPHDTEPGMWSAVWLAGSETFESRTNGWVHAEEVSHWMPLPAAPAMKSAASTEGGNESQSAPVSTPTAAEQQSAGAAAQGAGTP